MLLEATTLALSKRVEPASQSQAEPDSKAGARASARATGKKPSGNRH
jgi:hypothetical protein